MENRKSIGLPGGPNEFLKEITQHISVEGYKRYSEDVNNPYNIIESGNITMEDVDFPVMGTDNLGNEQMMMPGMNYQFPGDQVFEVPMAQYGFENKYALPVRNGVRLNYDEEGNVNGESTHIMRTETLDGKNWFSFPSLFQNEDGTWVDMSTSLEKDWMPVYEEAKRRGELIDFGTDKEAAIKFGEGSWKPKQKFGSELTKAQEGEEIKFWPPDKDVNIVYEEDDVYESVFDPRVAEKRLENATTQKEYDLAIAERNKVIAEIEKAKSIYKDIWYNEFANNNTIKTAEQREKWQENNSRWVDSTKVLQKYAPAQSTNQSVTNSLGYKYTPYFDPKADLSDSYPEMPKLNLPYDIKYNLSDLPSNVDENSFRNWINKYYPDYATNNQIDNTTPNQKNNDLIKSAWYELGDQYAILPELKPLPKFELNSNEDEEVRNDLKKPKLIKPLRIANRNQTVMEPDPKNPGGFRVKDIRQVPYSENHGGGWESLDAPKVMYYNPETGEETPATYKGKANANFQDGGESDYEEYYQKGINESMGKLIDYHNSKGTSNKGDVYDEFYYNFPEENQSYADKAIEDMGLNRGKNIIPLDISAYQKYLNSAMEKGNISARSRLPLADTSGAPYNPEFYATEDYSPVKEHKNPYTFSDLPQVDVLNPKKGDRKDIGSMRTVNAKNGDYLQDGGESLPMAQTGNGEYKVKSGDTFYGIANRNNISWKDLKAFNPDLNIDQLKLNQIIKLPSQPVVQNKVQPVVQKPVQKKVEEAQETTWGDYLNPYNWGVSDRDDDGTKSQAFRAARIAGEDEFMWHGKRYTTELAPTVEEPVLSKDLIYKQTLEEYKKDLMLQENGNKEGWDSKKQLWFPIKAPEKGGGYDIGYGHKISKGEDYSKGLTNKQVQDLMISDYNTKKTGAEKIFNNQNLDRKWKDLTPQEQILLTDYNYNGVLPEFKKFMEAIASKDKDSLLREFKRYSIVKGTQQPLSSRNDWTKSYIENKIDYKAGGELDPYQWGNELPIVPRDNNIVARDNTNVVTPYVRFIENEFKPKIISAPTINPNEIKKPYDDKYFQNYQPKVFNNERDNTNVVLPFQNNQLKPLTPEEIEQIKITDDIKNRKFVDPRDSMISKFINNVNAYGETIFEDYSNKSKEEIQELQQILIAEGYNVGYTKDDGIYGSQTQKAYEAFVDDKNLNLGSIDRYYKKYSESNKDEVFGIQSKLIEEGFLPQLNENGNTNADGKFGERTKNALQEYNSSKEEEDSSALIFDFIPSALDEPRCAAGMCTILEYNNIQTEALGIKYKDAWNILNNMEKAGNSEIIFNIYDEPEFNNLTGKTTVSEIKAKTNSVKSRKQTTKSDYKVGDIVGIYWPGSKEHHKTLKKDKKGNLISKTYNTHTGFVSDFDESGNPVITHNVDGIVKQQPYTQLQTAWIARPSKNIKLNKTYEVPKLDTSELAFDITSNLEQKWGKPISGKRLSVIQNIITRADYNAKNIPQMLNSSVDPDWLTAATIAITGVESGFGKDDVTPRTEEQARDDYYGFKGLAYDYKGVKQSDISLGIGKVKFSTIDGFAKEYFDINKPEDLSDDNKSLDIISYRLTKNYEIFKDYAKQYPELGLTDEDIKNMSILAHNQGNNLLLLTGRNKKVDGQKDKAFTSEDQVRELRKLYEGTINDVSSTAFRFLPGGKKIYDAALWTGLKSEPKTYINKVNDYIQEDVLPNKTRFVSNGTSQVKGPTNSFTKARMAKGGEYGVYNNYVNGDYNNTSREKEASDLYDKLNRIHYKDAKSLGMSPANYILTHVIGKA